MCFAFPGKIVKVDGNVATVDYGAGMQRQADLSMVKAKVGDYVIVNAGFAVEKVEKGKAKATLEAAGGR